MSRTVAKGYESFAELRQNSYFYVDKTRFIKDWWNGGDFVTLITRPRRFGKTLMLDTVKTFFSPEFAGRSDLFEGLEILKDEKFRKLQGSIPIIFLSFANIKGEDFFGTVRTIKFLIQKCYAQFRYLLDKDGLLLKSEREDFLAVNRDMLDADAKTAILSLSELIFRAEGKKPIILLDEYDTPLQEAWTHGYWDKLAAFMRGFFNSTFKSNPYLGRGLISGITRVSKESIFSDLNNLEVITTTSNIYSDCFGFTEQEVIMAMDEYGLTEKEKVKEWYDGFIFGSEREIYNPWSIINYLSKKTFAPYWARTSENALVNQLIVQSDEDIKDDFSILLNGESITVKFDEEIIFSQLYNEKGAIWSFLMASGYVKPLSHPEIDTYEISFTNYEVQYIMEKLISNWFNKPSMNGMKFREALFTNNIYFMNQYLRDIVEGSFSFFDTGRQEPERFYHGFILGLIVDLKERFIIKSNRESGLGRHDIMMLPRKTGDRGIVIEFKVMGSDNEKSLAETCANALRQIHNKHYIKELQEYNPLHIYVYGFAFKGKDVLICGGDTEELDWEDILSKNRSRIQ